MGVHVKDYKRDGDAWIIIWDKRLPKGELRRHVGADWKAARKAATVIRERLAAGDFTFLDERRASIRLKEAVSQYLDERVDTHTLDSLTDANYRRALDKHVWPALGERRVETITRDDLLTLFKGLLRAGRSKSLCRNLLAPIKQTYEWLVDDKGRRDLQSPAVRFGRIIGEKTDKKKRVQPLTPEQQIALLDAAWRVRPRYWFLFLVACRCGLRVSECFGVQWTDFDLSRRVLHVERQFRFGHLIDRTKKNKVRDVDLSEEVVRGFARHRELAGDASPFVFTTNRGGPIHSYSSFVRRVLRPVLAEAKITRRVTPHHFRQTFGSDLVAAAGERGLLYASQQMGHSSIQVTADYYARPVDTDRALVNALDARVQAARVEEDTAPGTHPGRTKKPDTRGAPRK